MYHCFRLRRGQDLYEEIEAYVKAHHIAAGAVVSGAAAVVSGAAGAVVSGTVGAAVVSGAAAVVSEAGLLELPPSVPSK